MKDRFYCVRYMKEIFKDTYIYSFFSVEEKLNLHIATDNSVYSSLVKKVTTYYRKLPVYIKCTITNKIEQMGSKTIFTVATRKEKRIVHGVNKI